MGAGASVAFLKGNLQATSGIPPALADDVSEATSTFSILSRTPSILSVHSEAITLTPPSPGFIAMAEITFGSDWREVYRNGPQ